MAFGAQWSLHFARTVFFLLQLSITAILYSLYQRPFDIYIHIYIYILKFHLIVSISYDYAIYYQIKTPISFWCRQELNSRSFIQLSKTLLVELT